MIPCFLRVTTLSSTSQLFTLAVSLCLLIFKCGSKSEIPFWLESNESELLLSYNQTIQKNIAIGIPQNRSKPEFDTCLHSRPAFYRINETGLNVSYCSTSVDSKFNQFVTAIFSSAPTAFPIYQTGDILAKVVTPAQLRDTLGKVRLIYCESDCKNGFHLVVADQVFTSTPFQPIEDSNLNIARRFYSNEASLAINDHLWLLYRLPFPSRILAIKIGTATQAQQVIDFFNTDIMARLHQTFDENQKIEYGTDLFVSGSYSGDTGGAGNEELILSSANKPIKIKVEIKDNQFWLTMFANSSVVLYRDDPIGFKFQTEPNIFLSDIVADKYKPTYEVFDRVALRKPGQEQFSISGICLFSNPCSPADIPIDIAIEFDKQRSLKLCSIEDFEIVEVNPFGLFTENKSVIDTGGKFIELNILEDCVNRSLFLSQDDLVIGLPEYLHQGALLLTAEKSYFNVNSIEYSLLRRLKTEPIVIHDSTSIRLLNIETIDWIYGSRGDTTELSKVHSLVNKNGLLIFHDKSCVGLRPDYCLSHSMSPGYTKPNLHNTEFSPLPKISEILAYLNNRFIEIYCQNCDGQAGRIDLLIERSSDKSIRHFAIPIPNTSVVSLSPTTVCGGSSIRYSDLYLPASAAVYQIGTYKLNQIQESKLQVSDTWIVSQLLFNKARTNQSSLITDGESIFESNDDIPNGCTIRSSPNITQIRN